MTFQLSSPAFESGGTIPIKYTCDGENMSLPLTWTKPPEGTQSLALILDDPDAPHGTWTHWVLFNISSDLDRLPENLSSSDLNIMQARNSYDHDTYDGPCPPSNASHNYHFRLFALKSRVNASHQATSQEIASEMQPQILGSAELTATYARQGAAAR
jgi:Raf kinase inhibitor-like YbhB/YbcL family protein